MPQKALQKDIRLWHLNESTKLNTGKEIRFNSFVEIKTNLLKNIW